MTNKTMKTKSVPTRIAVIGDVHLGWGEADVRHFEASSYDLVVFVGDLAAYGQAGGLGVARSIARLGERALVVPGNHDGTSLLQLASEVVPQLSGLRRHLGARQGRRCDALSDALGSAPLAGYSRHELASLQLVVGRPHSCGGPRIGFPRHCREQHGVTSFEDSVQKICALVDGCDERALVFVAHNGPAGLGATRDSLCGRDFHKDEGDWGDRDLEAAVDYALTRGHEVVAVLFGHMHHRLRGGGYRKWQLRRDGVLYVNAARVPRVFEHEGRRVRHHLCVEIGPTGATAREVLVPD